MNALQKIFPHPAKQGRAGISIYNKKRKPAISNPR